MLGGKGVPITSSPSHAHTTVILSQYLQQNNYFPLSSLLAPFPRPGIGNGQSRPPLASAFGTGRPSSPGPLSIPAGIQRSYSASTTRAAPAPLPTPLPRGTPEPGPRCCWRDGGAGSQPGGRDLAVAAGRSRLPRAGLGSSAPLPPAPPPLPAERRPPASAHGQGGCECALGRGWAAEASLGLDTPTWDPCPDLSAAARGVRAGSSGGQSPSGWSPPERGERSSSAVSATRGRAWSCTLGAGPPLAWGSPCV